MTAPSALFAPKQQGGGWGFAAEPFLRMNESALALLDVRAEVSAARHGPEIRLVPGGSAGAIPLRSPQTGHVVGGLVIRPRFGWSGVGRVLSAIGWHAAPEFSDLPLVPGSGREVPPWVLAGPVLARLAELMRNLRRGYRETGAVLSKPRGHIQWQTYITRMVPSGQLHRLPCRFPDLANDQHLRRQIKWTLERIRHQLLAVGRSSPEALSLATWAQHMLEGLADIAPLMPPRGEMRRATGGSRLFDAFLRQGLEAMAWVVEERGLGGGRELDGLAWHMPLSTLWESYVEAILRREAAMVGADLRVGRAGQTNVPMYWSDPSMRSLGQLVPDFILRRREEVTVVDAKYKAHFAELDERGWKRVTDDIREAHRADIHQVLAYAALTDAKEVGATLVYPLRHSTYRVLQARGRDRVRASLSHGGRAVTLCLRGLPFGEGRGGDDV